MRRLLAAAALAALALGRGAEAAEPGVEEFRLENGLTVLLRPIAGAEDVALVTLFSIGEAHDPADACGTAHLLEHLYVTAAAGKRPARTAEDLMRSYPQRWNAQTGWDYTVVATVFRKADLGRELEEAAARMGDLRIEASDLEREVPRVLVELENMYGGFLPLAAANHAANSAWSRTSRPHGGDPGKVGSIGLEALRARLTRFYKPRNAMVVLAGAVDAATRASVEKEFGAMPGGEIVPPPSVPPGHMHFPDPPKEVRRIEVSTRLADVRPRAALSVALRTPVAAAWLVVASRLWKDAATVPPMDLPVVFAPLDRPESLSLVTVVGDGETPEQALARLDAKLKKAAAPPLTDGDRRGARESLGFLLGLSQVPDAVLRMNPYGVAFGIGRRRQMGIDPAALGVALDALKDADLKALDLRAARVVVGPKP
jgi:zinc protease